MADAVPAQDPSRRYILQLLAVLLVPIGWLALFNISADAFGIYRKYHLPHLRTEPVIWSRVSAAERIADNCQVVLMGSSRVMHGFGPRLPRWGAKTVCNGALAGTSIREQLDVFDWMVKQPDVKHAILFIDFHMFNDARGTNGDFKQSRFNPARSLLGYHGWALTSFDAVKYSFRMIGHPLPWVDEPLKGPPGQMRSNKIELYRFFNNPKLYLGWQGDDETMDVLGQILDEADRHDISLMLVIPPVHAMLLETEYMTGVADEAAAWKRQLVEMLDRRTRREVPLWDFSTWSAPVTQPMPLDHDDPINPWWIDVSHQSLQLGWMTITRIADGDDGIGQSWESDFGVKLTPDNIDAHLAQIEAGRTKWLAENPDQKAWLEAWAGELAGMAKDTELDPAIDAMAPGEFSPRLPGDR